jgi:putative nucleotidyltransferase with HDIG domain
MTKDKQILLIREFLSKEIKPVIEIILSIAQKKKVYLVGGAIRDILLGRTPCDFDFAIAGSGVKFAREFAKRIRGSFVLLSEKDDEARIVKDDIIYDFNGIGNKQVYYDLRRRDFTINAIAVNLKRPNKIIDYFSGLKHLAQKKIVPTSNESLKLDPLRILRAFRQALEFNFKIDDKVFVLAKEITLNEIASERISYELLRICEHPKSFKYIKILYRLGFITQIFPLAQELVSNKDLFAHSLRTYKMIEAIVSGKSYFSQFKNEFETYFSSLPYRRALLKIAGLLHDIAKPHTEFKTDTGDVHFYGHDNLGAKIVQRMANEKLRFSRKQTQMLKDLVAFHMRLHLLATAPELTDRAIRRFFRDLGDEFFGLMILTFADGYATAKKTGHLEEKFMRMMRLKYADDKKRKVIRLINGDDLIAIGYKPGPEFKPMLQELEEMQLDGKINTKEQGLEYIQKHYPIN